jgi:hypothetical protein
VLGVLRELGAVVLVESQPPEGSSFTVFFPAVTMAEPARLQGASQSAR